MYAPRWCYVFSLLCCLLAVCSSRRFDARVRAACASDEEECKFTWHLSKLETLVYYNETETKGYPLMERNDQLYVRLPNDCMSMKELQPGQIDDVITADGIHRYVYSINNQFPGPTIVVYEGQQVVVKLTNDLLQEGTTLHWHGMRQRGTNFMDGTGSVTQCPINPGETFTYRFIASPAGTHWYHSHTGMQRTDGLNGAIVVLPRNKIATQAPPTDGRQTRGTRHNRELTDDDNRTTNKTTPKSDNLPEFEEDFIFLVHDWFHEESDDIFVSYYYEVAKFHWDGYNNTDACHTRTQQLDGGEVGTVPFQSGLINGRGRYSGHYEKPMPVDLETFTVKPGKFYRFRAINTGMNFGMKISIDQHRIHVIASDGMPIEEVVTDAIIVHGGERYDFYVQANLVPENYLIRAETLEITKGPPVNWDNPIGMLDPKFTYAVLNYEGVPHVDMPTSKKRQCTPEDMCYVVNCPYKEYPKMFNGTCINFDKLKAKTPNSIGDTKAVEEHFLNFHFPFGLADLLRSQVNGIQFRAPSDPPVVTDNKPMYDTPCDLAKCDEEPCHCTYQVNITHGNEIFMVLTSTVTDLAWEGLPATVHPVHLHGHHFQVVKVGYAELDPVTKRYTKMNPDIRCTSSRCNHIEWVDPSWKNGNAPGMNLVNPPLKDTVTVPIGGYVVIRFAADNPGWWIMHCHLELHQVEGMALIIKEGESSEMRPVPKGFPTCGSFDWTSEDFHRALKGTASSQAWASVMTVLFAALFAMIR